jgi:hypothetical protein
MRPSTAAILILTAAAVSGLPAQPLKPAPDYCGGIDLDQGWSCDQREDFWFRPQGSRLLPYRWFLNLEQASSTTWFRDDAHLDRLRFVTAPKSPRNSDALPVGFTREPPNCAAADCWTGFTCAACHTAKIEFKGKTLIVDGAPGMLDFSTFLDELVAALEATVRDAAKFDRFATAVLGTADPLQRDLLRRQLQWHTSGLRARADINRPVIPYGFARVDAFGHIFNQVLVHDLDLAANIAAPNAPVSYPCLWDTPQHDFVQWNGSAQNDFPGNPIFRNIGEALGVFGMVDVTPRRILPSYRSSIGPNLKNLRDLEELARRLSSPQWPVGLYSINATMAAAGAGIYKEQCATCHPILTDRKDLKRKIRAVRTPVAVVDTDPIMARNFVERMGQTGRLAGSPKLLVLGPKFTDTASALDILSNVVLGVWAGGALSPGLSPRIASEPKPKKARVFLSEDHMRYKARPLNGVWATAPYLHNGSVPNLWELLSEKRSDTFRIGDRVFDPEKVGFTSSGGFVFDTKLPGNWNTGHRYGLTLDDSARKCLIEFLKGL